MKYYYVVSAFPPISLEKRPEISYEGARELALLNLTPSDAELISELQRAIDIRNIRAFWLNEELDFRGSFGEKELQEELLVQDGFPSFVINFLKRYEAQEERLRYFSSLYASLYSQQLNGFLGDYYKLEREIRLVLTALRAKISGRSLLQELQFEDPSDPFTAEILAQKDSDEFIVPEEYEALKNAFLENRSKPNELYRISLEYRIAQIQEMESKEPFSMAQVLGYLARLLLIEDWWRIQDEKRGQVVLEQQIG